MSKKIYFSFLSLLISLILNFVFRLECNASPIFALGMGSGGDRIFPAFQERAGHGYGFAIGNVFDVTKTLTSRYEMQTTFGIITNSQGEKGINYISWDRYPLELVYVFNHLQQRFRFGWGGTVHFNNKISGDGATLSRNIVVDNATGWIFLAEKIFDRGGSHTAIGIKYTQISYNSPDFAAPINGDSIGVTVSFL